MTQKYTYQNDTDFYHLYQNGKRVNSIGLGEVDQAASILGVDLESLDFEAYHAKVLECLKLIHEAFGDRDLGEIFGLDAESQD